MMVETTARKETGKSGASKGKLDGVVIGMLSGFDHNAMPMVIFPGNSGEMPIVARTMADCTQKDIGREVALLFENGEPDSPIVIGLIQNPDISEREPLKPEPQKALEIEPDSTETPYLELDGERIELKAEKEITLKCGRASITLTRAGKVLIRGTYLLHRSSGVNRIKGGSVQIN